jgi:hypothetical protein
LYNGPKMNSTYSFCAQILIRRLIRNRTLSDAVA